MAEPAWCTRAGEATGCSCAARRGAADARATAVAMLPVSCGAGGRPRLAARCGGASGEQLRRLGARLEVSSDLRTSWGGPEGGAAAAAPTSQAPLYAAAWWSSRRAEAQRSTARGEASSPEKAGVMLPEPASLTAKPLAAPEGAPVLAGAATLRAAATAVSGSCASGEAARGEP